jgi:hypothetical protein
MSPPDVVKILERLATIEAKLDADQDLKGRMRRVELATVAIFGVLLQDAAKAMGVIG